jgi:hypothetical protein
VTILPADSLPITNVTGDWCFTALFSLLFAVDRKDRRDTRGKGMFDINGLRLELGERQHSMGHAKVVLEVVEIVLRRDPEKKRIDVRARPLSSLNFQPLVLISLSYRF